MYSNLLVFHSLFRWIVLLQLLLAIYRAFIGYSKCKPFLKLDNAIRHWTATAVHIQLIIGILLYIKSPVIQYFWTYSKEAIFNREALFFGIIHITFMMLSVVLVTIGSALAKRKQTDREKFKTMLIWFSIVLLIIFIAIPWPFSPFVNRTYFRTY